MSNLVITPEARKAFQKAGLIDPLQSYYRSIGSSLPRMELEMDIARRFLPMMETVGREYDLEPLVLVQVAVLIAMEPPTLTAAAETIQVEAGTSKSGTYEKHGTAIARPLSKDLLKKMSLKALAMHGSGRMNYRILIQITIPELLNIEKLTEEEIADGFLGIYELDRDGFIIQAPRFGPDVKMLTERGQKVATNELENMKLPSINIDGLISHDDLRTIVHDDYSTGDYETAIFKAFRFLEEAVRRKSGQPASAIGVDLMTTAFRVGGGILKHPEALVTSEAEAFLHLMRGAIGWFKNPRSHRTVGYGDEHQTAHVLCFANLLLDLLDACK